MQVSKRRESAAGAPGNDAVYAQLDRLLRSPFFSTSRRYPALLRYVVTTALEGDPAELKAFPHRLGE